MKTNPSGSSFSDTKSHFPILDGLRGVGAVIVIFMHIAEPFAGGDPSKVWINHGYLAVDFFFLLSGYVIAHAYDDRWHKMTVTGFFKRRLIRLHPSIIIGMALGAICFYFGISSGMFPSIDETPVWKLMLVFLLGCILIPVRPALDVRGWGEMFPLNGAAWSLFYEYCANILYALFLRRITKTILTVLVIIAAMATIYFGLTSESGDFMGGWSLTGKQVQYGLTRLAFPFFAGILLSRVTKPVKMGNSFVWCSLLLLVVLSIPRLGGNNPENFWKNGLYDAMVIILVFPLIVFLGASGKVRNKRLERTCQLLGDLSYPVYITHYPIGYIFFAWVVDNHKTFAEVWPVALLLMVGSFALAYVVLKFYDLPAREWLTSRFIRRKKGAAHPEPSTSRVTGDSTVSLS